MKEIGCVYFKINCSFQTNLTNEFWVRFQLICVRFCLPEVKVPTGR